MNNQVPIPGCPTIRALAFNESGVIEVIESDVRRPGIARVVEKWGDPDSSKSVVAASLTDGNVNRLLVVARSNSEIEFRNPRNGETHFTKTCDSCDPIVGLHVFTNCVSELDSTRCCKLLTCTEQGNAKIDRYIVETGQSIGYSTWTVSESCHILCSQVHVDEEYSIFGGDHAGLYKCDLEAGQTIWTAPLHYLWPPRISCTSAAFRSRGNHHLLVAGSNIHDVSFYDTRGPSPTHQVIDLFLKKPGLVATPIRAIVAGPDENTIYIGTDSGDIFSLDLRTGNAAYFSGISIGSHRFTNFNYDHSPIAFSGSIRFLARHHEHPLLASAGDNCVNIWDINKARQIAKVIVDNNLSNVIFDHNSYGEADQSHAEEKGGDGGPEAKGGGDGGPKMKVYERKRKATQSPNYRR
ncbi:hypothetical protein M0R45_002546 [Rubus argutus]|uniref:Uncharacterized protein n=1 Tax=Rubus argutus TaxID=59490 RepID=A0AAW1VMS5_RUBAR